MTSRHLYHVAKRATKAREAEVMSKVNGNVMNAKPITDVALDHHGIAVERLNNGGRYRGLAEIRVYSERASRKVERAIAARARLDAKATRNRKGSTD